MRSIGTFLAAAIAIAGAASPMPGAAQSLVSTEASFAEVTLLPGQLTPDGSRLAGLGIALAPGWKTYWRSPGDAGVPPMIDFSASGNLASAELMWPRPMFFESFGLTTLGYEDEVVLPLRLVPEDPAAPIAFEMRATIGVCREICVFEEVTISERIGPEATGHSFEIALAAGRVLPDGAEAGLTAMSCSLSGIGDRRQLSAELLFAEPVGVPALFLEAAHGAWFHDIETAIADRRVSVTATLSVPEPDVWLGRDDVRFTLLGDDLAADIKGCANRAG